MKALAPGLSGWGLPPWCCACPSKLSLSEYFFRIFCDVASAVFLVFIPNLLVRSIVCLRKSIRWHWKSSLNEFIKSGVKLFVLPVDRIVHLFDLGSWLVVLSSHCITHPPVAQVLEGFRPCNLHVCSLGKMSLQRIPSLSECFAYKILFVVIFDQFGLERDILSTHLL